MEENKGEKVLTKRTLNGIKWYLINQIKKAKIRQKRNYKLIDFPTNGLSPAN